MHPTNQNTINGKMTFTQRTKWRQTIWRYLKRIEKNQKVNKNGSKTQKGIQISYGRLGRKFKLSYDQVRGIINYFTSNKYLIYWIPPPQKDRFKTRGNFYRLNF